ncbi:MAG: hypothetical protein CME62_01335 [Halobacteriovoraceae bacterium]|nr:hypothetical protein [Halobacteriovoraceae bacterium]|tara:strand:- start:15243 stop:16139 length:897 start_codon:yes stop_codon:yes gene_type:complete
MKNLLKLSTFTSLGFKFSVPKSKWYPKKLDLNSKYFIVTGANSGLGFETAKVLLQMNANVIIICRSQKRMNEAESEFKKLKKGRVYPLCYDLSDLNSLTPLTRDILAITHRIDCLIHNAGALLKEKTTTPQGFETSFALMTLMPFKLTLALKNQLKKIVWVSSGGMYGAPHNLIDLHYKQRPYDGVMAYAENKRHQVDLAKSFADKYPHLKSYSMHPGWVDTPGVQRSLPLFRKLVRPFLRNYYQGCDTIIYLSVESLDEGNGEFWFDRKIVAKSFFDKGPATSFEDREKLWELLSQY